MEMAKKRRIFYLIIDQLAGHWADGVKVYGKFSPANVSDYHKLGLIPNFSYLIKNGLWVKKPWNKKICDTAHGMKYLANGCYNKGNYWIFNYKGRGNFYPEGEKEEGFFEFVKRHYEEKIKVAVFTTDYWIAKGYFYVPQDMHALSGSFPDERMWHEFALPYIINNPDWNLLHLYFPTGDTICYCPSYQDLTIHPALKATSKHVYLLLLDRLLGEVIDFLKARNFWDETYLFLASDHGYHLGCSVAHKLGVKEKNWCCDHPDPYDCEVWDFEKNESCKAYSGGPRRTTFILSGGALEKEYRGKTLEEAEIIDIIPTISQILDIDYKCEGKSILEQYQHLM